MPSTATAFLLRLPLHFKAARVVGVCSDLKKPSRKRKPQRRKKSVEKLREPRFSMVSDVLESLIHPKKQGWLYFGFFVFLAVFLGAHLFQAATSLAVPNIRTTDTVYFHTMPTWFTFVVLFKLVFWVFSVTYLVGFIKRLLGIHRNSRAGHDRR